MELAGLSPLQASDGMLYIDRDRAAKLTESSLRAHVQKRAAEAAALQAGPRSEASNFSSAFMSPCSRRGSFALYSDDGVCGQLGSGMQLPSGLHSLAASPAPAVALAPAMPAGAPALRSASLSSMWASDGPPSPQVARHAHAHAQPQLQLQYALQGPQGPTAGPQSPGINLPEDVMLLFDSIKHSIQNSAQGDPLELIKRSQSCGSSAVAPATPPAADRPQVAAFTFSDDLANMPDALVAPQVGAGQGLGAGCGGVCAAYMPAPRFGPGCAGGRGGLSVAGVERRRAPACLSPPAAGGGCHLLRAGARAGPGAPACVYCAGQGAGQAPGAAADAAAHVHQPVCL
jgi:hypothetical protein